MDEKTIKEFNSWGKEPPKHYPHGTEEDIADKMERLMPNEWRLEGNVLIGKTKYGTLAQNIPPNYILVGTRDNGLPKFKKIA